VRVVAQRGLSLDATGTLDAQRIAPTEGQSVAAASAQSLKSRCPPSLIASHADARPNPLLAGRPPPVSATDVMIRTAMERLVAPELAQMEQPPSRSESKP